MNEYSLEYCSECGEPTGNTGVLDGSIYIEKDGIEIGPLCEECKEFYENDK